MKITCPYKLCGAEFDSEDWTAKFIPGRGRLGKCPKCGKRILLTHTVSNRKRLTNSQKRKLKRELYKKNPGKAVGPLSGR